MKQESKGHLAAVLGASCCVLPLALIAVGLGGSLLTIILVRYKAWLMGMAAAALVFAWAMYARDARKCSAEFCEMIGGRLRKWMLGANTAVVVFFVVITYTPLGSLVGIDFVSESAVTAEASVPGLPVGAGDGKTRMERLALRVEGMS
ncbi:MAG: mercuric transporter MerT family protein [bacterium]